MGRASGGRRRDSRKDHNSRKRNARAHAAPRSVAGGGCEVAGKLEVAFDVLRGRSPAAVQALTPRSARESKRSPDLRRDRRRPRRIHGTDRCQRPSHPRRGRIGVLAELAGHFRGTPTDAQPPDCRLTAPRTWSGAGDSDGCRVDANSASARAAATVLGVSPPRREVFTARIFAMISPQFRSVAGLDVPLLCDLHHRAYAGIRLRRQHPNSATGQQVSGQSSQPR
ncbi:MAG: hypothetical protein QOE89_3169 [Pseudonocardiales bacterium]|nr:hypothetical protein [Pseudonocardiales bacterium]